MGRCDLRWAAFLLALAIGAMALAPRSVQAAGSKGKSAVEKLAEQAKGAVESGQHDQAVDLYLSAWRLDETQVALVYNAARAAHLGAKLDRAEELYRQYIALPGASPQVAAKAQAFLDEISLKAAEERADEASRFDKSGRPAEAVGAYEAAFRLAPSRPVYALRAARSARMSGDLVAAEKDYNLFLAKAKPGPERDEAAKELANLNKSNKLKAPAAAERNPEPPDSKARSQAEVAAVAMPETAVAPVAEKQPLAAVDVAPPVAVPTTGLVLDASVVGFWSAGGVSGAGAIASLGAGYGNVMGLNAILSIRYTIADPHSGFGIALSGRYRSGRHGLTVSVSTDFLSGTADRDGCPVGYHDTGDGSSIPCSDDNLNWQPKQDVGQQLTSSPTLLSVAYDWWQAKNVALRVNAATGYDVDWQLGLGVAFGM